MDAQFTLLIPDTAVQVVTVTERVGQVVVILTGKKSDERALPRALALADEADAELILIRMCKAPMAAYRSELALGHQQNLLTEYTNRAAAEVKAIESKLKLQYAHIACYLHEGDDIVSALKALMDDWQNPYIILPQAETHWLKTFLRLDVQHRLDNNSYHQVELGSFDVLHYVVKTRCWLQRLARKLINQWTAPKMKNSALSSGK